MVARDAHELKIVWWHCFSFPRLILIDFAGWTELEPAGRLVFITLAIFGRGGFRRRVISLAAAIATRKW